MNVEQLERAVIDDQSYWFSPLQSSRKFKPPLVCLLPPFDEYLVAYKDRSAVVDSSAREQFRSRNPIFDSPLLLNGRVIGGWKRTIDKSCVTIAIHPVSPPNKTEKVAILEAAERYAAFLQQPAVVRWI